MYNNTKEIKSKITGFDFLLIGLFIIGIISLNVWIVVVAGIFFIYKVKYGEKEYDSKSKLTLPKDFFQLSSTERKKSLDLAWNFIDNLSMQKDKIYHHSKKYIQKLLAGIFISIALFFFLLLINARDKDSTWDTMFFIFIFFFTLWLYFSYRMIKNKQKEKIIEQQLKEQNIYNNTLKKLAKKFIIKYYPTWIKTVQEQYINKKIKDLINTKYENIYTLFSYDYRQHKEIMPPKNIYLTYILTNENYITIISNIKIDIKNNSYQYINSDSPITIVPNKNEWNIKEFFYKDIIELDYLNEKNSDDKGNLLVGLVNGSKYKYPTLKKYTQNLFIDVREKMRKNKIK